MGGRLPWAIPWEHREPGSQSHCSTRCKDVRRGEGSLHCASAVVWGSRHSLKRY